MHKPTVVAIVAAVLVCSAFQAAAIDEIARSEGIVRQVYPEGIPYALAQEVTTAGAERLIAMLEESTEAMFHANILLILGMSGHPGAYEAIASYTALWGAGEVDPALFIALRQVPLAMGHLALDDDRALVWLTDRARRPRAVSWSYRNFRDTRATSYMRRRAIAGLGVSGRAEALSALADLHLQGTPDLRAFIDESLHLHGRVGAEGSAKVFTGAPGRMPPR